MPGHGRGVAFPILLEKLHDRAINALLKPNERDQSRGYVPKRLLMMSEHKETSHEATGPANIPLGLSTSRIEALTDGIFAVAMTLLVFGITVPTAAAVGKKDPVAVLLHEQGGELFIYALSFALLGVYWVGLHAQFQYIKRVNRNLLWINILILLLISFIPFTTSFLGQYREYRSAVIFYVLQIHSAVIFYGAHIVAIGAVIYFHWWYAMRTPLIAGRAVDKHMVRAGANRVLFAPVISLLAIACSFITPTASLICFALIPIVYIFPSRIDLHWTRPHVHADEGRK
jgi:uncharacterized membrane protein